MNQGIVMAVTMWMDEALLKSRVEPCIHAEAESLR
jgi:hypothetical protein